MSAEERKKTFQDIFDGIWNKGGDVAAQTLEESLTADFTFRPAPVPVPISREDFIKQVTGWHKAFPDGKMIIDQIVVEGNTVACFWTSTGTHSDEYLGVPATGKQVSYKGMEFNTMVDGKIQTNWATPDLFSLMKQFGVIPE